VRAPVSLSVCFGLAPLAPADHLTRYSERREFPLNSPPLAGKDHAGPKRLACQQPFRPPPKAASGAPLPRLRVGTELQPKGQIGRRPSAVGRQFAAGTPPANEQPSGLCSGASCRPPPELCRFACLAAVNSSWTPSSGAARSLEATSVLGETVLCPFRLLRSTN